MAKSSPHDVIRERLDKSGWAKKIDDVVAAALEVDGPELGLSRLADVAEERARESTADAARLALAALKACPTPVEATGHVSTETERERLLRESDQWARWRLRVVLREAETEIEGLPEPVQARVRSEEAAELSLPLEDLDAAEELVTARLAADGPGLADGLWATARALGAVEPGAHPALVQRVGRAALARCEKAARDLSEPGESAIFGLRQDLWTRLVKAWLTSDEDEPEHTVTRRWFTGSSGGAPRTAAIEPEWLTEKGRDALLDLLRQKHSRTQTSKAYGHELLRLGRSTLTLERRIELAREVSAVAELIDALFEAERSEEAVEVALEEARSTAGCPDPLSRAGTLEAAGHADAAVALMRIVIERSVDVRHFEWLAGRLVAGGDAEGALGVRKQLFERRCGLTTYEQLREHCAEGEWPALRKELLARLAERRLFRIILDIAFAEDDVELAVGCAEELDDHQRDYVRQRLDNREDAFAKKLSEAVGEASGEPIGQYRPRESMPPPARVKHKKYGVGTVKSHSGDGEHRKLEIDFKNFGTKTILERFVTPLDGD